MAEKQKHPASGSTMRGKGVAALLSALGAALVLTSVGREWAHGTVSEPLRMTIHATGSQLSGVPDALGLAGLAGAVALFAVRRIGRYAVGVLLTAAGAGVVATVVGKLSGLDAALARNAAANSIPGGSDRLSGIGENLWPYVAVLGGVLIALAGIYTLAFGRGWTGLSSRYEAPDAAAGAATADGAPAPVKADPTVRELWDALGRGADPTSG